jgi:hypothetical protein
MSSRLISPMGFIVRYLGKRMPYLTLATIGRLHSHSSNDCVDLVDDLFESSPHIVDWDQVASIRCTEL